MTFIPAATVAGIAIVILVINQQWVGMAEATPFKLFFKYADQHHLSRYISPYLVLFLEEASSASTGRVTWESLIHPDFARIWVLLHFGVLPFGKTAVLGAFCVGVSSMLIRGVRERLGWPALCLGAFLLVAALISSLVNQPASLFRFYIFTLPVVITTLAVCIVAVIRLMSLRWTGVAFVATPVIATILGIYVASFNVGTFADAVDQKKINKQLQFIGGYRSLAKSIGIMPKCTKMYNSLSGGARSGHASGASVKMWTLTFLLPVGCYLLPQPRVLMEMSASFGPYWHRIVFGSEEEALHELENLGIRYFYVDLADFDRARRYSESTSLMGCLAYSRLFAPAVIPKYFRVVWRDEDAFLLKLVSAGQGGTPVPDDFIWRWPGKRNKVQYGLGQMEQLCERVAGYFRQHGENWPVNIDPALPKLKGWQRPNPKSPRVAYCLGSGKSR